MLYAVLCYNDEKAVSTWTKEEDAACMARLGKVQDELRHQGRLGPVVRLQDTTEAKTLRKANGEHVVFDGPFAETKEQLGGYHLIECQDLDAAISIAKRIPTIPFGGAVELRALL